MLEQLSLKIAIHWANKDIIPREDTDIYRFGIEVGISTLVNLLLLMLVSLLFFDFIDFFIFITFFVILRQYSGGYHADTHIKCNAITLLCYCFCTIISHHITVDYLSISILFMLGLAMMVFTAPIKNHNKTMTPQQLTKYKALAVIIFFIEVIITYALVMIDSHYSSNAFCTIVCIIILMLLGMLSYKRKERNLCSNS